MFEKILVFVWKNKIYRTVELIFNKNGHKILDSKRKARIYLVSATKPKLLKN